MAQILPMLNLNRYPANVKAGSLVNARNVMIADNAPVVQSEVGTKVHQCTDIISKLFPDKAIKFIYGIPCNTEVVWFVQIGTDNTNLKVVRYFEDTNNAIVCCDFDYHGGKLLGTFTYNRSRLFIGVSEYFEDDSQMIPLRTIDLGERTGGKGVDDTIQLNTNIQSVNPEVRIPNISTSYLSGVAYKGWYYIFIRYKLGSNTYTQWYNTNAALLVDNFATTNVENYYVAGAQDDVEDSNETVQNVVETIVSDDKDLSSISFKADVIDIDPKYNHYQLGFICITKSYTKCYRTSDIQTSNTEFTFSNKFVIEASAADLIKDNNNYYNVKSLTTVGNRLYIGNYYEAKDEREIAGLSDITCQVNFINNKYDPTGDSGQVSETIKIVLTNVINGQVNKSFTLNGKRWNGNGFVYFDLTSFPGFHSASSNWGSDLGIISYNANDELILRRDKDDTVTGKASQFIFAPELTSNDVNGEKGAILKIRDNGNGYDEIAHPYNYSPSGSGVYMRVVSVNGKEMYDNWIGLDFIDHQYWTYKVITNTTATSSKATIAALSTNGVQPSQPYNFFIHFVDKYGHATKGFNLSYLNLEVLNGTAYTNNLGNKIIVPNQLSFNQTDYMTVSFTINKLPNDYIGYFFSYEALESSVKYKGICGKFGKSLANNEVIFYSDELNFADTLDFGFNKIKYWTGTKVTGDSTSGSYRLHNANVDPNTQTPNTIETDVTRYYVADTYNNVLNSTHLVVSLKDDFTATDIYYAELYNDNYSSFYNKENKSLVPCSKIQYGIGFTIIGNTRTGFTSKCHALVFEECYFNETIKAFQKQNDPKVVHNVFTSYDYYTSVDTPWETLQFNNKPITTFFPIEGLDTEDVNKKSFAIGNIVESKNTIDLYQQKNTTYYSLYPKTLDWFNPNVVTTNKFDKTIRRSQVIQDESVTNSWRSFDVEDYKNINENKGSITKLIGIGSIFLVHTQHSMFMFDATNSLKGANNTNLQLASIDIWDISYKEVITSSLGYAGLAKEEHGIAGNFGYIFYSKDDGHFYSYDNNKFALIDKDINKFVRDYPFKDIRFIDDKYRNRLIIRFIGDKDITLSYSYNYQTFVSFHDYDYTFGISSKDVTYIVDNTQTQIATYTYDYYAKYNGLIEYKPSDVITATSYITTIDNTAIETIKSLDSIIYDVNVADIPVNDAVDNYGLPVERRMIYAAVDTLDVASEYCDTGKLDVHLDDASVNINKVTLYNKPYWRFGNWHFNALRDKLIGYIVGTDGKKLTSDEVSRMYGNWFTVTFQCNTDKRVQYKSINYKYNNSEVI